MFEAGAIAFRLAMVGAEVFKRDAKNADQSVKELGDSAEKAAKKVGPLGDEVDKSGRAAKGAQGPLDETGKSTKKLGDENTVAAPKVKQTGAELDALKSKSDAAARTIGVTAMGIGAALTAMAVLTVSSFATFDASMSKTAAATMATSQQKEILSAAALDAGAASIFSAKEAADAETELAKAGLKTSEIVGGALNGSLALAAAGQLGVARAAEISATALTVFKLKGDQASHVADLLAAGAGKAQGSVDDLALGLDYVGVTFARLNIPLEDTVGTLALLASNGLLGEKAGTGLRSVISSLTQPVAKGAEVMKQYGINVFDAQGNFITMAGVAEQLKNGLGGLDEQTRSAALGAIFGAEAASAAGILYSAGAAGVDKWTKSVDDQGYAVKQAAMAADNLTGDIERLGGSMDTALIKTGSSANDSLRGMVQTVSGLVDWYGGLNKEVQGTTLALGVGTAAVFLLSGTLLLGIPKVVAYRAALTTLRGEVGFVDKAAGGLKGTLGVLATVALTAWAAQTIGNLADMAREAAGVKQTVDSLTKSLDAVGTKKTVDVAVNAMGINQLSQLTDGGFFSDLTKGASESAEKLAVWNTSLSLAGVTTNLATSKMKALDQTMAKLVGEGKTQEAADLYAELASRTNGSSEALGRLDALLPGYQDAMSGANDSTADAADKTGLAATATTTLAEATDAATKAHDDWIEAVAGSDASFINLVGGYDAVIEKNKAVAESTADSTEDSSDSWSDYYDGFEVNLGDYLAQLQSQVDAQSDWESNMVKLSGRVSQGVLDELAKLGPEGAPLVADLVNASDVELATAETLFAQRAATATGAFATTLSNSSVVIAAAAAQLGQGAADEITTKLSSGTATVEQILTDYGIKIDGFQPSINVETARATAKIAALYALITKPGRVGGQGPLLSLGDAFSQANGAVVSYHANGSVSEHHTAQIERAGAMRVWAEPETGGEAYIPLAGSKRGRSTAILADVADQFGYQLVPAGAQSFAAGGTSGGRKSAAAGSVWTGDLNVTTSPGEDPRILATQIARMWANQMAGH
ncbi:phage tail tape measure protein [Cryobacterium mannosilyticum]|uniref:Phage tail tape measure protein n=1 Tax=Cryobacterium mannosilyticum TaxID=1259190 RepID=A0A4R8W872_9MICO|nr:phage tail tape measure protein [Cryobacterium mannosilyticum]TFC03637.1 phage tail tape measure protein [Cryobacterium mannosilyticum]